MTLNVDTTVDTSIDVDIIVDGSKVAVTVETTVPPFTALIVVKAAFPLGTVYCAPCVIAQYDRYTFCHEVISPTSEQASLMQVDRCDIAKGRTSVLQKQELAEQPRAVSSSERPLQSQPVQWNKQHWAHDRSRLTSDIEQIVIDSLAGRFAAMAQRLRALTSSSSHGPCRLHNTEPMNGAAN